MDNPVTSWTNANNAPVRQTLPDEVKDVLRTTLGILDIFVREHPTISAQAIRMFCLVALREGLSVTDYQQQSGQAQSVTSRYLLDIGERNRYMRDGLGWITQRMDPLNRRKHQALLTDKGRALAHAVARIASTFYSLATRKTRVPPLATGM